MFLIVLLLMTLGTKCSISALDSDCIRDIAIYVYLNDVPQRNVVQDFSCEKELYKRYRKNIKQKRFYKISKNLHNFSCVSTNINKALRDDIGQNQFCTLWLDNRYLCFGFVRDIKVLAALSPILNDSPANAAVCLLDVFLGPQTLFDISEDQGVHYFWKPTYSTRELRRLSQGKLVEFTKQCRELPRYCGKKEEALFDLGSHQQLSQIPYFFTLFFCHWLEHLKRHDIPVLKAQQNDIDGECFKTLGGKLFYFYFGKAVNCRVGFNPSLKWFVSFIYGSLFLVRDYLGKENFANKKSMLEELYLTMPSENPRRERALDPSLSVVYAQEDQNEKVFIKHLTDTYLYKLDGSLEIFKNLSFEKRAISIYYAQKIKNYRDEIQVACTLIPFSDDFYLSDGMPKLNAWVEERYGDKLAKLSNTFKFHDTDASFHLGGGTRALLEYILFWMLEKYEVEDFLQYFGLITQDILQKIYEQCWSEDVNCVDCKVHIMQIIDSMIDESKADKQVKLGFCINEIVHENESLTNEVINENVGDIHLSSGTPDKKEETSGKNPTQGKRDFCMKKIKIFGKYFLLPLAGLLIFYRLFRYFYYNLKINPIL